jgi:hypothetical protein
VSDAAATGRVCKLGGGWPRAAVAGAFLTVLFVLAVAVVTLPGPVLRDPSTGFATRRGHLQDVEVQAQFRHGSSSIAELRLVADSGLVVELAVRIPDGATAPLPTVLLLGGKGTGRDAARLGGDTDRVVIAALSYPFDGDTGVKGLRAVLQARRIQRAVLDTVPAILLATDYLLERPYVDPSRYELVGVSLGAFLVSPAAVLDERIARVWLVHGSGQPAAVLDHALREDVGVAPVRRLLAAVLDKLVGGEYLAAEHWVGRVAPRPVIVINARDDESLPPASVAALHRALQPPCEIVWTDGPHVQPSRDAVIDGLRALVLERMTGPGGRIDRCPPQAAQASSDAPASGLRSRPDGCGRIVRSLREPAHR